MVPERCCPDGHGVRSPGTKSQGRLSDYELAAIISNAYMPHGGGQYLIFIGSTSITRPHLIFPNQFPTHRKTRKGDIVLTELSADYHMHAGQAHRPISVGGKPTPIYEKLYESELKPIGAFSRQ
jgi:Xaa-Pro aminopeptidase